MPACIRVRAHGTDLGGAFDPHAFASHRDECIAMANTDVVAERMCAGEERARFAKRDQRKHVVDVGLAELSRFHNFDWFDRFGMPDGGACWRGVITHHLMKFSDVDLLTAGGSHDGADAEDDCEFAWIEDLADRPNTRTKRIGDPDEPGNIRRVAKCRSISMCKYRVGTGQRIPNRIVEWISHGHDERARGH